MHSLKFKTFAPVNGHNPNTIHVRRFGGNRPINSIIIERFDTPNPGQELLALVYARLGGLTTYFQNLIDRDELLLSLGMIGDEHFR
ncbi:hypothetical protein ANOBCDAF_04419 [Pleomorphomonas sp. T1.2MG-36]|nr:hypothetical protein ANOBCDAF_04419 [Pleomorphomonas sp. T1.2MG-36]